MTTFQNSNTNETVQVNLLDLIGKKTNSLYIRKGFKNGTLFLSQRGNGEWGAEKSLLLELGKSDVEMLIEYLTSIKDELGEFNGGFVPVKLESF